MGGRGSKLLCSLSKMTIESGVPKYFLKVFVLTVVFGLFHGLLLFPSLLAMLGPQNRSDIPITNIWAP